MIDCHMHTPLCGHAVGQPESYLRMAAERGIRVVTFTCHIPMEGRLFGGPNIRMRGDQLPEYLRLVEGARPVAEHYGIELLCGIEAEVFPDAAVMHLIDETLEAYPFDYVLGSLHHPLPGYRRWLQENERVDDHDIVQAYFAHLALGALSGRYHSMAHPDVIRLYGTLRYPFRPQDHEAAIRRFLQATVDQDICMEVNTSGLTKGDYVVHPDPIILRWAAEMGVKLTLGSDAHVPESVGQFFGEVIPQLQALGFDRVHYHRRGERIPVELGAWARPVA